MKAKSTLTQPRLLGLICGAGGVVLGMAYMIAAKAPLHFLLINLAALMVGSIVWASLGRFANARLPGAGIALLALAVPLVLTALFGTAVEGASRWVSVGQLNFQLSLVILPIMIVLFARRPDVMGTIGMIIAALALALQPDRAMAGVLLAGLIGLLLVTPSRLTLIAMAAAGLAFCWTILTPDTLPAVPFVDGILYTAFDVHPLAGLAVLLGAAALVLPPVVAMLSRTGERDALFAFAGCWMGVLIAAALGNYPTPLVGYGGSAVLGYLFSVALLPNISNESARRALSPEGPASEGNSDRNISELRIATFPRPNVTRTLSCTP